MNLIDIRQFFAEEIRAVANIQTDALVAAFAKVPREHFLGLGPWRIAYPDAHGSSIGGLTVGTSYRATDDADPRHLYHNVLIAIDPTRQLNNGHPSTLASWLDALELKQNSGSKTANYRAKMRSIPIRIQSARPLRRDAGATL